MIKQENSTFQNMEERIFFISGHERSGTHWVGNLLNLHPKISSTGEFHFDIIKEAFEKVMNMERSPISEEPLRSLVTDRFETMVHDCIIKKNKISSKPNAIWFGDRTPRMLEPLILEKVPHFFIFRDVRDVLVSWTYFALSQKNLHPQLNDFNIIKKNLAKFEKDNFYFRDNPHKLLEDKRWVKCFMRGWKLRMENDLSTINKAVSGEINCPIYVIKYERLHSDIEKERNKMYEYLKLDPKEALPLTDLTSPGFKKENTRCIYRKGIIGDWENYFTQTVCEIVKEECGTLLIDLGYEKDSDWNKNI